MNLRFIFSMVLLLAVSILGACGQATPAPQVALELAPESELPDFVS